MTTRCNFCNKMWSVILLSAFAMKWGCRISLYTVPYACNDAEMYILYWRGAFASDPVHELKIICYRANLVRAKVQQIGKGNIFVSGFRLK